MLPVRGLLLNSRMILAFLVVEAATVLTLDSYFYRHWVEVKYESIRKTLVSQVDQLAQQAIDLPDTSIKLKSNLPFVFQVLNEDGLVLWDSVDQTRIQKKMSVPHFLFKHALKNPIPKDLIEFDDYYGAFKRNSNQLIAIGAVSKQSVAKEHSEFLEKLILLSIFVFSLSTMAATLLFYFAGLPIRQIAYASLPFLKGQLAPMPSPRSGEPAILALAFQKLTAQVEDLLQDGIQKVQIEQEVNVAASLQKSLLPPEKISTDRYEIESYYAPATKAGGDYWGYFETKKYLVMYIADATGHGLSSSMITSAARGCFSALQQLLTEYPEIPALPSFMLKFANQAVINSSQDELNMTMFIATYSFEEKKINFASAGHNAAWLITNATGEGSSEIKSLHSKGQRLGETADYEPPLDQSIPFSENDLLCLYTDGVLDCNNAKGDPIGRKSAKRNFFNIVQASKNIHEVKEAWVTSLESYTDHQPLEDDITFAILKVKGKS